MHLCNSLPAIGLWILMGTACNEPDANSTASAHESQYDTAAHHQHAQATDSKREHGHDQPKTAARWYCTMHGKPAGNTVHAISGEGETLGNILEPVPESAGGSAKGVRGMLHTGEHGLLVVSANMANTRLLRYGPPASDGTLPFSSVFASKALKDPNLVHSYSLAVGADGTVYASSQDTNTVTGYLGIGTSHPGQPIEVPTAIAGLSLAPGTVVPSAIVSPQGINEIRGIAISADGLLYVADRGASQVVVFDSRTGLRVGARAGVIAGASDGLVHPIQLLFAPDGFTLYLTDSGMPGVFRIDTHTGAIVLFADLRTGCPELPSSLALDKDYLYVGDRKKKQIVRFKIATGEPDHKPFAQLPDAPEFMIPASLMPTIPHPPSVPASE